MARAWPGATLVAGPQRSRTRPQGSGLATLVRPDLPVVRTARHAFRTGGDLRDSDTFATKGAQLVAVRVAVTVGNYRQTSDVRRGSGFAEQSYGWKPFQDVRYEHEWQWGPDASARYGVGARRFAYDGVYETKSYLYLGLNWRF